MVFKPVLLLAAMLSLQDCPERVSADGNDSTEEQKQLGEHLCWKLCCAVWFSDVSSIVFTVGGKVCAVSKSAHSLKCQWNDSSLELSWDTAGCSAAGLTTECCIMRSVANLLPCSVAYWLLGMLPGTPDMLWQLMGTPSILKCWCTFSLSFGKRSVYGDICSREDTEQCCSVCTGKRYTYWPVTYHILIWVIFPLCINGTSCRLLEIINDVCKLSLFWKLSPNEWSKLFFAFFSSELLCGCLSQDINVSSCFN